MTDKNASVLDDMQQADKPEPSDFSKVVEILTDNKYKRRKTVLNTRQIAKLTTIDVLSQIYDVPFLKAWVNYYAEWRTSGDKGRGRQDIVDISKFHYAQQKEHNQQILDLMKGR